MNDCVGNLGTRPDAVEVVQIAPADPGAHCYQRGGGAARPGEPGDLMPRSKQFIDGGRADPSSGSGDEYVHVVPLLGDVSD
jgi:hypothetical protein